MQIYANVCEKRLTGIANRGSSRDESCCRVQWPHLHRRPDHTRDIERRTVSWNRPDSSASRSCFRTRVPSAVSNILSSTKTRRVY